MILPTAFLTHEDRFYQTFQAPTPTAESPWTPITALIEGVWAHDSPFARKILRQTIVTRFPVTPLCEGMINVAGKRYTVLDQEELTRRWMEGADLEAIDSTPSPTSGEATFLNQNLNAKEAMALAVQLSERSAQKAELHESDRKVGAVLLSKEGKVISTAWNTNSVNRTHHAELKLIRNYLTEHNTFVPEDCSLYVTLQPCAMCAAQIFTFVKRPESIKIFYLNADPGPLSKNSVLNPGSDLWKKAGSPKLNSSQFSL